MSQFMKLGLRGHRIAIAGLVADGGTGLPLVGVEVRLTVMPERFSSRLALKALEYGARWASLMPRPDRVLSGQDGSFRFLDLPAGDYTVTASWPGKGTRYSPVSAEATVIEPSSAEESPAPLPGLLELRLPPTALTGVVQTRVDLETDPVCQARLRIKGSGETTTSDPEGRFSLSGIEPGRRTLEVSARGYQPATLDVQLLQGSVTSVTLTLEPVSGL